MQIVIPMSGFGERFRRAGYKLPKPLIEVDGKPIIAHVLDLFPGETRVTFICNEEHLASKDYDLKDTLLSLCPSGSIVSIAPHRLGPVHAVQQVYDSIESQEPVVVNYCDFTCYWNYQDFKQFVVESDSDGCLPAYRGFHPHILGPNNYAFIKEHDLWLEDIREKEPFTDNKMEEFASSGTYYFRSGAILMRYFDWAVETGLSVNGEFYASLPYRLMAEDGLRVSVYELQHFMQWGTPEDLGEYQYWSSAFERLASESRPKSEKHCGSLLMPMAGAGSRFANEGYLTPKPLIEVSGEPMVLQAARDLPLMASEVFILRSDVDGFDVISAELAKNYPGATLIPLSQLTEGQACTALLGAEDCDPELPVVIGACDAGLLYSDLDFQKFWNDGTVDLIVWGVRHYPSAARRPQSYGWLSLDGDQVVSVSVKKPLAHPESDPVIVGSFAFRRAGDLRRCVDRLIARNGRVNGEFYLDSCLEDAVALGLNCRMLECSHYLSWGTPQELKTFNYWQSCFSKWSSHPYNLTLDSRIPIEKRADLQLEYQERMVARPSQNFKAC